MGYRSQIYHGIELMILSVLVAKKECSKFSVRFITYFTVCTVRDGTSNEQNVHYAGFRFLVQKSV